MYVLVLGLDVLGNPFGVIRGLGTGVQDLFYEPYQVSVSLLPATLVKTFRVVIAARSLVGSYSRASGICRRFSVRRSQFAWPCCRYVLKIKY